MSRRTPHICSIPLLALTIWQVAGQPQDFAQSSSAPRLEQQTNGKAYALAGRKSAEANRQASTNWYDTSNRAAIRSAYNSLFAPTAAVPMGWTGSISAGVPGTTSQAYKDAVLTRINWFRAMAGVPPDVTLNATYSAKAQQAALMMSANRQLSHTPASSWLLYTVDGAEAAGNSNLCLGFSNDPGCIALYIQDNGSNNAAVGHRRWILYPQVSVMGTGDVSAGAGYSSANALWVFDGSYGDPRPATRDPYVAWPPRGYVPFPVVPQRWSFSHPSADFSEATVSMQRGGSPVTVQLEPVANGYGENTIVWIPAGVALGAANADSSYTVTISNARVGGIPETFTYNVVVFDPAADVGASFTFTPTSATMPATGGSGSVALSVSQPGATWTAASNASWLQITSGGTGTGSGTIAYTASPNAGASPRTATITAGSATFTITQAGASGDGGCAVSLSTSAVPVSWTGQAGTLSISAPPGCSWTASSSAPWVQVYPLTGTGNAVLQYTVFPQLGTSSRSSTISVRGSTAAVSQTANPGSSNERFVQLLYFNYFGRLPSSAEVAYQAGVLASGTPRSELVYNFFQTAEFNGGGRFVAGLYVGLLDRDAEYGGWLFQRNALAGGGVDQNQLVANFIGSAEYALRFGSPVNAEYVRLLYRKILLREPSQSEVNLQVNALLSGISRTQLASAFLNSQEFRTGAGPRLFAFLLHATLLQRDPSSSERSSWVGYLGNADSLRPAISAFLTNPDHLELLQ